MICPQCSMEMEPTSIPYRWECRHHEQRLYVQEPEEPLNYEDMGIIDYAILGERRQEHWELLQAQRRQRVAPTCPACGQPMTRNKAMRQWECHYFQPPRIITDAELAQEYPVFNMAAPPPPMTATEATTGTTTGQFTVNMQALWDQPPIEIGPPPWPFFGDPISIKTQRKIEAEHRDATTTWFNAMPKSLKLLYIALDADSAEMMDHFKNQDVRHITYRNMHDACQRMLIKKYMEQLGVTT